MEVNIDDANDSDDLEVIDAKISTTYDLKNVKLECDSNSSENVTGTSSEKIQEKKKLVKSWDHNKKLQMLARYSQCKVRIKDVILFSLFFFAH